jgi:hypothetical protein
MATNHVDQICRLALENSRLHGALPKAERIRFEATGKSLSIQIGPYGLHDSQEAPGQEDQPAVKANHPALPEKPVTIPANMVSLDLCKAPALQSNPSNFRLGSHPLTDEQQQSLEFAVGVDSLKVEAGAGSGKTSSLTAINQNMGRRKGLYLAFNSDIIKNATPKFYKGTSCRTTHSVAFEGAGYLYKHMIQKKNLPSQMIIDTLLLQGWNGISRWAQANVIRQWVVNFTHGAEPGISIKSPPGRQSPF